MEKIKLTISCKGTVAEVTVKETDELSCTLLGNKYKFTIDKINHNSIIITTTEDVISFGSGILESEKEWNIKRGKKLSIHTNSTDWQEKVEFS